MKLIKYFFQFILIVFFFSFFKIFGFKLSSGVGGKLFEIIGPFFRSKKLIHTNIKNLKNYQHIFINGNNDDLSKIKKDILEINSKINIHVGIYQPLNMYEFNKKDQYLVFSGIGNHQTFISMIKKNGLNISKDIEFPDHYKYMNTDIDQILNQAHALNSKIITTEKDYLRLEDNKPKEIKFIKSTLKIIDEKKLINTIIKINETN